MTGRRTTPPLSQTTAAGLHLLATADPDDPLLDEYYAGYDRSFVLEAEKEPLEGFRDCMALNDNALGRALRDRYGPFRELVVLACAGNETVGGANLSCFQFDGPGGPLRTIALNYVHVLPAFRRRGYSGEILRGCAGLANQALDAALATAERGSTSTPLTFIEQHDPLRLAAGEGARDSERAGIGQMDRLRVWSGADARIVDFDYIQPPLAAGADAAGNLLLSVTGVPGDTIDACTLGGHLERFFAISCLKGRPLAQEPTAQGQIDTLAHACRQGQPIALLDPRPWLATVAPAPALNGPETGGVRAALTRQPGGSRR
jgi:GNAT superfamily N-acetyltransferase